MTKNCGVLVWRGWLLRMSCDDDGRFGNYLGGLLELFHFNKMRWAQVGPLRLVDVDVSLVEAE